MLGLWVGEGKKLFEDDNGKDSKDCLGRAKVRGSNFLKEVLITYFL